ALMVTRREFLATSGLVASVIGRAFAAGAGVASGSSGAIAGLGRTFAAQAGDRAASSMRFGYAAITWGNNVAQAIDDIAAVGFRGIQLRAGDGTIPRYGANPAELRELLERRALAFAVLSSGNLSIDPAREHDELATHAAHARFLGAAGGRYLQVI